MAKALVAFAADILPASDQHQLNLGLTGAQFTEWRNVVHDALKSRLGPIVAEIYLANSDAKRNGRFTLHNLEPDQIHFTEIDE